jgi:hypothetical protein
MALMLVLNLVFMVAALAGAMLQVGSLAASGALAAVEHVRAFHAADAVMMLCEQHVLAQRARERDIPDGPLLVFGPDARLPGSIRLPECAVERIVGSRTRREGYRITARGFGSMADTQSWTQLDLAFAPGILHRTWRPLIARPVPDPWRGAPRSVSHGSRAGPRGAGSLHAGENTPGLRAARHSRRRWVGYGRVEEADRSCRGRRAGRPQACP